MALGRDMSSFSTLGTLSLQSPYGKIGPSPSQDHPSLEESPLRSLNRAGVPSRWRYGITSPSGESSTPRDFRKDMGRRLAFARFERNFMPEGDGKGLIHSP